ncbi:MAG TPA: acetyl-CoA hydrolase/transferase C-terminal domain-containing protein [Ignavibacteriales bacterium]|nr:acetyl-CoA hydrolase/transferase C-terminal domain-containing protein [Ignavibacteriales bacterium]HOL81666.1 acetyl-CoA hydrolase/transferase C-terminal domain-containing protein [Ignavibacteriales bacterium]HOM65153.1 acetyl-CoA hydrolase/transferase C-terminal domain-containing protein [Ignavibacteriales bacterium]HPD66877.1 acetyl-CoA hydrolase/transferase C-terminal domain-containing protein [Ignavibacteriales bacterium]HPP33780.1 acetyl-CoA hydrolase/transferase C-terminal domain-conta
MENSIKTPAWLVNYNSKLKTADEAVKVIKSGDGVYVQPGCAVPFELIRAMVKRKDELENVNIYHILAVGKLPYMEPGMEKHFRHTAFFIGHNTRKAVNEGRADFVPCFLHEVPLYFKNKLYDIDVALIHVSPPDEHGFCSYGVDVGCIKTPAEMAKVIIAQVNPRMPRTLGNSFIHISKITHIVEHQEELTELPQVDEGDTPEMLKNYDKIGEFIADLIEDGSTLQMGIGAIPDSVLKLLQHKKDLGVHTEMFSDGLIQLIDSGVMNGEKKSIHKGKLIAGFILGTRKAFDYADNNPLIEFHPQEYVNDPFVIAQNTKMVAINSAIEVDITGQVCSDSIGTRLYSGFGGQVDFIRGAARSEGGKPIIALTSTTRDGEISRISTMLKQGAGVVTSRADVHYVVTEFGVASLNGKSIRERIKQLINIAHPKFRDELKYFAKKTYYLEVL